MFKELDKDNNNSLDANEIRAPCLQLHLGALNQKYLNKRDEFRDVQSIHENKTVVLL